MSTTLPDTAATRRDIARAREDMGQALFQLADRLAPKKLVARLKETAKLKVADKIEDLKARVLPAPIARRLSKDERKVIPARRYEAAGTQRSLPR